MELVCSSGGGSYDKYGLKTGHWIDLYDIRVIFGSPSLTSQGEYKNGKRIGKWINTNQGYRIGGGNYNDIGLKSGLWIETNEDGETYQCQYQNGLQISNVTRKGEVTKQFNKPDDYPVSP